MVFGAVYIDLAQNKSLSFVVVTLLTAPFLHMQFALTRWL